MIDFSTTIVSKLKEIGLDVHFENFLDSTADLPCISYFPLNNSSVVEGDLMGYGQVRYRIKVWAKSIPELVKYSSEIDDKMRELGMTRTNSDELWIDSIGQRFMNYENLYIENFNER